MLIPQPSAKKKTAEPTLEEISREEQVERERGYFVDTKIIKIMKTRKQETHNKLVQDVLNECKDFRAQP
jgi:hypothetical protein